MPEYNFNETSRKLREKRVKAKDPAMIAAYCEYLASTQSKPIQDTSIIERVPLGKMRDVKTQSIQEVVLWGNFQLFFLRLLNELKDAPGISKGMQKQMRNLQKDFDKMLEKYPERRVLFGVSKIYSEEDLSIAMTNIRVTDNGVSIHCRTNDYMREAVSLIASDHSMESVNVTLHNHITVQGKKEPLLGETLVSFLESINEGLEEGIEKRTGKEVSSPISDNVKENCGLSFTVSQRGGVHEVSLTEFDAFVAFAKEANVPDNTNLDGLLQMFENKPIVPPVKKEEKKGWLSGLFSKKKPEQAFENVSISGWNNNCLFNCFVTKFLLDGAVNETGGNFIRESVASYLDMHLSKDEFAAMLKNMSQDDFVLLAGQAVREALNFPSGKETDSRWISLVRENFGYREAAILADSDANKSLEKYTEGKDPEFVVGDEVAVMQAVADVMNNGVCIRHSGSHYNLMVPEGTISPMAAVMKGDFSDEMRTEKIPASDPRVKKYFQELVMKVVLGLSGPSKTG